jgi:futalosine hydrolase
VDHHGLGKTKRVILVVCAVAAELRSFASRPGVDVVAVGVGPVEAGIGTMRAICNQRYRYIVNAGIGGGFRGRAKVGDAIAVTEEHYADIGLEGGGALNLPDGITLHDHVTSDEALLMSYRARVEDALFGIGVTSATITTTDRRAKELGRFTPTVESMEGFAVLAAAANADIPAIELRGISNLVGVRAESEWDFRAGAAATVRALEAFIEAVTTPA